MYALRGNDVLVLPHIKAMSVLQYRFLGYARNDDSAKRYQNSAALHYYLRRTNPFEAVEPTEPALLFRSIKGQHAPWANPEV